MLKRSVLLQVRVPERVLFELDRLIEAGLFRSRSEAVVEGIRRLILAYSLFDSTAFFVERYLSTRQVQEDVPEPEIDVEEAKRRLIDHFGTANVGEVLGKMRMRA